MHSFDALDFHSLPILHQSTVHPAEIARNPTSSRLLLHLQSHHLQNKLLFRHTLYTSLSRWHASRTVQFLKAWPYIMFAFPKLVHSHASQSEYKLSHSTICSARFGTLWASLYRSCCPPSSLSGLISMIKFLSMRLGSLEVRLFHARHRSLPYLLS